MGREPRGGAGEAGICSRGDGTELFIAIGNATTTGRPDDADSTVGEGNIILVGKNDSVVSVRYVIIEVRREGV